MLKGDSENSETFTIVNNTQYTVSLFCFPVAHATFRGHTTHSVHLLMWGVHSFRSAYKGCGKQSKTPTYMKCTQFNIYLPRMPTVSHLLIWDAQCFTQILACYP